MKILVTGESSEISQAIKARRTGMGDGVVIVSSKEFAFENPAAAESHLKKIFAGGIDAVVLNAFARLDELKPIHEWSFEDVTRYLRLNIEANLWLVQFALPYFLKQKSGRFILISSLSADLGTSRYGPYVMAKAALEGLMKNLATDYSKNGILSNIVQLGMIQTRRNSALWRRSQYVSLLETMLPSGAAGTPAQVAASLDSLLADECYITGSTLRVGGGLPSVQSADLLKAWIKLGEKEE
jgi:3-oxoacyl-[acyl-carrier protein] reductase